MLGLLGFSSTRAQDVGQEADFGDVLTADALVERVLEANAGLAATRAGARAAARRVDAAGALDDPRLSYVTAPRSSDRNVELAQPLPWPGTLAARESAARFEAEAAAWRVDAQRLELETAANQAYADWYFVGRALEINASVQSLVNEMIATAQTRYSAGRASRQDLLQAEVEKAELEARALALRGERTSAAVRINALLNRSPAATLPPPAPFAIADTLAVDLQHRPEAGAHPELERLDAEVEATKSRVAGAQKTFFPQFQVRAGYNMLWDASDKRPTIGVSINVPFARSKRRAELDRARAERLRAEFAFAERRAQLDAAAAAAQAAVEESLDAIELYEQRLVPLAGDYLDAALADYRSGSGSFLGVISAEQRQLETELALEQSRADYLRRMAEFEALTGATRGAAPSRFSGETQ